MFLHFLIAVLVSSLGFLLWKLSRRQSLSVWDVEVQGFDSAFAGAEIDKDGLVVTKLAFATAMAAKEKFGELRYNTANRCVVGDFARKYLMENHPDLRVIDRVKHAQYAVELALLPTTCAVMAARFSSSSAVRERRGAISASR